MDAIQRKKYIEYYAPYAQKVQQKYGVPASVQLAQLIQESGWDGSELGMFWNNLFGIKGTGDLGSVNLPSPEEENGQKVVRNSDFAWFSTPEGSFEHYAKLVTTKDPYVKKKTTESKTPYEWVDRIAAAGYATDSNYANALKSIIRSNNLEQYDKGNILPVSDEKPFKLFDLEPIGKPKSVIEDVWSAPGDESPQDAYDRYDALNPKPDISGWIEDAMPDGLAGGILRGAAKILIIVLLLVFLGFLIYRTVAPSIVK